MVQSGSLGPFPGSLRPYLRSMAGPGPTSGAWLGLATTPGHSRGDCGLLSQLHPNVQTELTSHQGGAAASDATHLLILL